MAENPSGDEKNNFESNNQEFKFASKEGLIIVSLILFIIYTIWYKFFEAYYFNKLSWIFIFSAYSFVVFVTMIILFIVGVFVIWKDRRYIYSHEKLGGFVFLLGAIIFFIVPLGWTFKFIEDHGVYATNSMVFIIIGAFLCAFGSLILARTGGFFTVWLTGVFIYLIASFHESFQIIIQNGFFGSYDTFIVNVGIYVGVTSFVLFLYHDLKFLYLSKIIKQGNKYRKEKKYRNAKRCFNKTIKIYPLFTTAWNNMGNVYFNEGKINEAIKCYKKALTINPDYINAKKNLEVVTKRAGRD